MTTGTPAHISEDLAAAGDQLHEAIRAGLVTGLIFGAMLKGRRYFVSVAGTLARDPTLARGVAAAIDDELARLLADKKDSHTTI